MATAAFFKSGQVFPTIELMRKQEMTSIAAILDHGLHNRPGDAALLFQGRHFTWSALAEASTLLAALIGEALPRWAAIGILLPNRPEFAVALFAAARNNGTAVLLDPRAGAAEVERILADCRVEALVTTPSLLEPLRGLEQRCADLRAVILAGDADSPGALAFSKLPGQVKEAAGPAPERSGAHAICQYTSGVSGYPKIIRRSSDQLLEEIDGFTEAIGLTARDRVCTIPPLHHSYGLMTGLLSPLHAGAELLLRDGFVPGPVLETLASGVTVFIGVPYFYQLFLRTHLDTHPDLSNVRVALSAGAPLDADTATGCRERFGMHIRPLYGLTETGVVSVNRSGAEGDGVGRPIRGMAVELVDSQGHPVPDGTAGEIVLTSSAAAAEYFHLPEASRETFRDGRFCTGDLGRRDTGGNLHITGRIKTLINISGKKVDPGEVEQALSSHPRVRDVAVLGCPHPSFGEAVKVVLVTDGLVERMEITRFCRERLAAHKVPSIIEFVEQLPRSATGKVLKKELIHNGG